jgi:protein TonB
MKKLFFCSQKSQLLAFVGAFAVHAAVVIPSFLTLNPVVVKAQTIQVSFVAPNAAEAKNSSSEKHKVVLNEKSDALKQKQNDKEQKLVEADKKSAAGKNTSGRVDPNATATKAAESDPVFDAAYLNNPSPDYPLAAKRKGAQGKVLLNVTVKTDGTPLSVTVAHSSGCSSLDEAALEAVKQWRFIPAKRGGELVQASVTVPVEFKMI